MLTDTKTLTMAEGSDAVSNHGLVRRKILLVCREGSSYDLIRGIIPNPNIRQCDYIPSIGGFRFDTPAGPGGEKVFIWYVL